MSTLALDRPAGPQMRLGLVQLVLRRAAGQTVEQIALLFGLALQRLQARLRPAHVQALVAGLRGLAALSVPARRSRLLERAQAQLALALAAGRPGAARYVELMTARGQDAARQLAACAWRLVGRAERVPEGLPAPRRPRAVSATAARRRVPAADRAAHRFARELRNELIALEGMSEPAEAGEPDEPEPEWRPRPAEPEWRPPPEPSAPSTPLTPELLAYRQAEPQPLPRNVFELELYRGAIDPDDPPWLRDEWQFVLGHHSDPDEPPWDPEEEYEKEMAAADLARQPRPPDRPDTPEQHAIDLAFLDEAIRYRMAHLPEGMWRDEARTSHGPPRRPLLAHPPGARPRHPRRPLVAHAQRLQALPRRRPAQHPADLAGETAGVAPAPPRHPAARPRGPRAGAAQA
jgi:hypothetical protein